MNYRGLDLGTGFMNYSNQLAKGYRDMLELRQKQQQLDYVTPQQVVIPGAFGRVLTQHPANLALAMAQAAEQQRPEPGTAPQRPVYGLSPDGTKLIPLTPPPAVAPSAPAPQPGKTIPPNLKNRNPSSDESSAQAEYDSSPEAQPDMEAIAKQIGGEYKDGQLVLKGGQARVTLELLDKLIGSSAAAFNSGLRPAPTPPPATIVRPPPKGGGGRGQTKLDNLKVQLQSIDAELGRLTSKPFLDAFGQATLLKLQRQKQQIMQEMKALPTGASTGGMPTGRSPAGASGSWGEPLIETNPQALPAVERKGFSPSRKQTFVYDAQGNLLRIEDGDTR